MVCLTNSLIRHVVSRARLRALSLFASPSHTATRIHEQRSAPHTTKDPPYSVMSQVCAPHTTMTRTTHNKNAHQTQSHEQTHASHTTKLHAPHSVVSGVHHTQQTCAPHSITRTNTRTTHTTKLCTTLSLKRKVRAPRTTQTRTTLTRTNKHEHNTQAVISGSPSQTTTHAHVAPSTAKIAEKSVL